MSRQAITTELQAARELARQIQRTAQSRKHRAGDPRNPFRSRPGYEDEFAQADRDARAADRILKELAGAEARERAMRLWPLKRTLIRTADRVLDVMVGAGLIALASMGAAAVLLLAGAPDPVTRAAALLGAGVTIAGQIVRATCK